MQSLTIKITVPRAAAVASRSAVYGDADYELAPEEIGELSTAEAIALLRFEGNEAKERLVLDGYPQGPSPDFWPLIRAALQKCVAEVLEQQAERERRSRARLEFHQWAVEQDLLPSIRAAALHDYDVSSAYVFELAKRCADIDPCLNGLRPPIITCTEQLEKNATFELRTSPSLFARTLESRLKVELVTALSVGIIAPGTRVDLSPVQRMSPNHGDHQTVVVLRISHPATAYGATVIWSAEVEKPLAPAIAELREPGPEPEAE